jgi:translation initiation factor 2-alpha kinase 4
MSEEQRVAILKEVTETQEALRELRKQPPPQHTILRKISINEQTTVVKPRKHSSSSSMSFSDLNQLKNGSNFEDDWHGVKTLWFQLKGEKIKVERLSLIGNNINGGSVYCGYLPDMGGKLVAISEWNFAPSLKSDSKTAKKVAFCDTYSRDEKLFLKQLTVLEQELFSMIKLSETQRHPNIVQYLGLSFDNDKILRIYEEFVLGANFSSYLSENLPIEMGQLKHYSANILEALAFMHEHNFVHRDLRDTSIYMESSGLIKVGDFSIDKRVRDLVCSNNMETGEQDKFPLAIGRGGKKVDIYRFGVLLLSFAVGEIVHDPVSIPKGLPSDFTDFLKKCLNKDERDRWSAPQLLEHSWIKNRLDHIPTHNPNHNLLQEVPDND